MVTTYAQKRKRKMARIKGKNTRPELLVRSALHKKGYRFRLHYVSLPGKPDIVLKKYRTVIFVNGCFWHQHRGCRLAKIPKTRIDFWKDKLRKNVRRQHVNIAYIKCAGYKIIVVWECQIYKNTEKVVKKIIATIKK